MAETVLLTLVNASNTQILSSKQDRHLPAPVSVATIFSAYHALGLYEMLLYRHGLSSSSLSKTLGKNHSCNAPPPPYAQQTLN